MVKIQSLLPSAAVVVGKNEVSRYREHWSDGDFIVHDDLTGGAAVRNFILNHNIADIIVMIDDDFACIKTLISPHRAITNPDDIFQILSNSAQCCIDLGLGVFCFNRSENVMMYPVETHPIKAVAPAYGCVGVCPAAKGIMYDEYLKTRADLDWSMSVLLKNRIVFCDMRFYFDFGASFSGSGGNSGLVSADDFDDSAIIVKRKWGKHIRVTPSAFSANGGERKNASATIRIRR